MRPFMLIHLKLITSTPPYPVYPVMDFLGWQVVFGKDYIVTEAEFETQPNRLVFVTGQPQAVTENTTQQEAPGGTGGTGVDRAAKTKVVAVVASLLLIIVYFAKRF
jgi:hypothetical protein